MQHDYEQLGDRRFQQLCQAVLLGEYPGFACLPVGMPDGGRDGLVPGVVHGSSEARGTLVFQVKYVERPDYLRDPTAWVEDILEAERAKVDALLKRGAERYILVTNVPASSHLDHGSFDKVRAALASTLPIPAECLWRGDLDRRLEGNWDLKWSYPELMTGTDLIRALVEGRLSEAGERRGLALRAFVADQHRKDSEVRFKQADLRSDLLDVFIDVPAAAQIEHTEAPTNTNALDTRIRHLDRRTQSDPDSHTGPTRAHGAGSVVLDSWVQERAPKLVVEGAPGQGKSTMLQYVCQAHRVRLLAIERDVARLPPEHRQGGVRIPVRVELRHLAQWLAGVDPFTAEAAESPSGERTLEGFVAALIRSASGGARFDVDDLHAIADVSPVLLALDGLDEVVDVGDRGDIVEEITRAVNRLDAIASSLQVVVTSRPASFTTAGRFPTPFQYVTLTSLTRRLIHVYRDRWLDTRDLEAFERRELSETLDHKLSQPHFRDLCRNPMQLAIVLSLLHRKGPALPEQRTDLYRSYMEYFLDREAAKSTAVRDHRELLLLLHGHIAWLLHIEAERSPRQGGRISKEQLIRTAEDFVASRGHDRNLFSDLFGGVFDRVGALVSRVQDIFEFEVQPLREYFAGYYLYETAPYSPIGRERAGTRPERLDAMLPHRFWLNVARFYAGCYSVGELESLAGRLEAFADDDKVRWTALPRIVTAQLLADWALAQDPRAQRRALGVMLRDLGSRHTASGYDQDHPGMSDQPFVLPAKSGGAELVDSLLDAAMGPNGTGARLRALTYSLELNASTHDLAQRWLRLAPAAGSSAEDHWWQVGERLAVFLAMDPEQLKTLLGRPVDPIRLLSLVRCGQFSLCDESPETAAAAIDHMLSGVSLLRTQNADHPLAALDYLMTLDRTAVIRESRFYFDDRSPWVSPTGRWPSHYDGVVALARVYQDNLDRQCQWTRELAPWITFVDEAEAMFGQRAAFHRLALVSSGVRDASQRGGGHPDLHDNTTSLVLRARHARYRAGDIDWWRQQLEEAPTQRARTWATALLLVWARTTTIAALQPGLTEQVEAMSTSDFSGLSFAVDDASMFPRFDRRSSSAIRIETGSPRLFKLLALRMSERDVRQVYQRAHFAVEQEDSLVLRLLLGIELDLIGAARNSSGWDRALAMMERGQEMGADQIAAQLASRPIVMPEAHAQQVVTCASRYPLAAVEAAEARLARSVVAKMPTVGQVARRDKWFPDT